MKIRRCTLAILVACMFLAGTNQAQAWGPWGPRGGWGGPAWGGGFGGFGGGFGGGGFGGFGYGFSYGMSYSYFVPVYAIGSVGGYSGIDYRANFWRQMDAGFGYDCFDAAPRMRASLYPAVPFPYAGPVAVHRTEPCCIRYEITVPCASATVFLDGVETRQTGLNRVYITPPVDAGRDYTVKVTVQWKGQDGAPRTQARTLDVQAGATVRCAFTE